LPKKEHWYKIDYSAEKFTDEQVKLMSEPAVKENGKKLDLPPPNVLLPSKFEIHADSESKLTTFVKHWDESDLWFKKDDKFKKPKGNIAVKIYTNDLHFGTT
jgi:secreted Zn-dependent insulinase-like peptidase